MNKENKYIVINNNKMDYIQFHKVMNASNVLKEILKQGSYLFVEFEQFMFDVFLMLYKPIIYLNDSPNNSYDMLRYAMIQNYLNSPSINKVRIISVGNRSTSYLCLKWLIDKILERTRGTDWFDKALSEANAFDLSNNLTLTDLSNTNFNDTDYNYKENNDKHDIDAISSLDDLLHKLQENDYRKIFSDKDYTLLDQIQQNLDNFLNNIAQNNPMDTATNKQDMSITQKNQLASNILSKAFNENTDEALDDIDSSLLDEAIEKALSNLEDVAKQKNENTENTNDNINKTEPMLIEDDSPDVMQPSDDFEHIDETAGAFEKLLQQINEQLSKSYDLSQNDDNTGTTTNKDNHSNDNLKDEIIEEFNQNIAKINNSSNGKKENLSVDINEIDSDSPTDYSNIQHSSYKGDNNPISTEFIATNKKWNPTKSPRKTEYKNIIPAKLQEKINAINFDNDLSAIEHEMLYFEDQLGTMSIDKKSLDKLSFDELLKLHKRFKTPSFVNFINKVGRQKVCARKIQGKKKLKQRFHAHDKLTRSQDLDLMVDDELINIALDIEAFENDFYDRYLRKDLLTVEMTKEVGQNKGPIILCYDGSGSMEGIKIEETQSHILSIIEIARIQKRSLILIQFASASEPLFIKKINPNRIDVTDILDILDTFLCGGTDFEKPLSVAIDFIRADKKNNSDILFITDGECEISRKFLDMFMEVKIKRKFSLYTIIIHSYTYHDYGNIGEISDEVLEIGEKNWRLDIDKHLFSLL